MVTAKRLREIPNWLVAPLVVDVFIKRPKLVFRVSGDRVEERRLAKEVFVGLSTFFGFFVDLGLILLVNIETFLVEHCSPDLNGVDVFCDALKRYQLFK